MNLVDWSSVIGCIITALSILLAFYFYKNSHKTKKLVYDIRSFQLLSDTTTSLPDFRASFRNQALKTLTAAQILLMNSGTTIINESDIANTDPIKIQLPQECKIYLPTLNYSSNATNNIQISPYNKLTNILKIEFSYLARKQGCVISFLHSCDQNTPIIINGTIKGEGNPQKYNPNRSFDMLKKITGIVYSLFFIIIILLLIFRDTFLIRRLFIRGAALLMLTVLFLHWIESYIPLKKNKIYMIFKGEFTPNDFIRSLQPRKSNKRM